MAAGGLGAGKTVAAAQGAWICFEDEAGQNMRPPIARTWARRGQTTVPVVRIRADLDRGRSASNPINTAGGCTARSCTAAAKANGKVSPKPTTSSSSTPHTSDCTPPLVVIWDNLNTHISAAMRALIDARDWLTVIRLPAYAPDLNPVEAPGQTSRTDSATSAPEPWMTCTASSATGSTHPVPTRTHRRIPRPDRPHPRRRRITPAIQPCSNGNGGRPGNPDRPPPVHFNAAPGSTENVRRRGGLQVGRPGRCAPGQVGTDGRSARTRRSAGRSGAAGRGPG